MKLEIALFSFVIATIVFATGIAASIVQGQHEPYVTVQVQCPTVHPELNEEFNLTVIVVNASESVNGSIRVAWNNTSLQLVSFPNATSYTTDSLNFTLTFVSNSTVPSDLRVKALLSEAYVYDAPWQPEFNSIQTGVE